MLNSLLSGRARFVTHLVGWALVALLFFTLIGTLRGPADALARTGVNMVFLLTLFYGNAKILINRFFEKGRYLPMIFFGLILWLGMAALRTWVEVRLFGGTIFQIGPLPPTSPGKIFAAFALSFFLLLLFSTLYQLLENRHTLELRHRELETRHVEAQLNYLKAQINPHFLFNTLNNIYAAATLQHPNTAEMVLRLSDLLRYVTYDGRAAQVPLDKEIAQITSYLELIRLKTDQVLNIQTDIAGASGSRMIEPVLLLPLVENAVKHGDLEDNPAGFIRLTLRNDPGHFYFRVENTVNPENRQKDTEGGVGLENIRRRLALNYRDQYRFETAVQNGIFTATLEIRH